ncbi:MAG: hypothetical protein ABI171_02455 [Collimonas sp.]|uniref:hypothetical protein n=1 Tax=Collimonas sp. TaxID=1963772 RepID=UPI003266A6D9
MNTIVNSTFGTRTAYNQSALTDGNFSQVASSDGFVMATVGQPTFSSNYLGTLEGFTVDSGGSTTSFVYATGLAYSYNVQTGKKGATTILIPMPGSFTMPVRQGETWNLRLTWNPEIGVAPQVEFYWIPGLNTAQGQAGAPASQQASIMKQAMNTLRDELQSGKVQGSMLLSAQQAIDSRVHDLAHILGDSVSHGSSEQERQQFLGRLQKIVCSAAPQGQKTDNIVDPQVLQELIASFGQLSGHVFSVQQSGLIEAGVRALVQINDNDANRRDLSLINRNIGLFIDNMQQVLDKQFSNNERRLLTRALVRIVGDGTRGDL